MESLNHIIKVSVGVGIVLFFIMVGVIVIVSVVRRWFT